jgi:aminopeptidase
MAIKAKEQLIVLTDADNVAVGQLLVFAGEESRGGTVLMVVKHRVRYGKESPPSSLAQSELPTLSWHPQ